MTKMDDISEQHESDQYNDSGEPVDEYIGSRYETQKGKKKRKGGGRDNRKIDPKRLRRDTRKNRTRNHSRNDWD